ncbi:MAG: hypothetical protein RQ885_11455 [Desulfurococcales archaeon]|nr:hypothetical protein [Desulfurococcales archaeon]
MSGLKLISIQSLSILDDEVISLLDLGVERPREAMMLRAPETEALDEGYAQKGFGVLGLALDGSPVPLGSTATHEPTGVSKILWGRWKSPNATGSKPCGSRGKAIQQKNISDNQQPSGDKRLRIRPFLNIL